MKDSIMLTLDNLEEIAQRIKDMLEGRRYTFVACNEFFDFRPEVRTDQEIKADEPLSTYFDKNNTPPEFGGFHIGDTYGVWGLSTNTRDATYDHTFKNPYVVFEYERQIKIIHRAPSGLLLYWTIAIQGD